MSIKSNLAKVTAQVVCTREEKLCLSANDTQRKVFKSLITKAKVTKFGKDHHFDEIANHSDFTRNVPVRDYEKCKNYFERIRTGERDVCWPGVPKYLAKTSGTTSGVKYIPITRSSVSNHINSARNALFSYVYHRPQTKIFDGKMLFLSGSPILDLENGIHVGRLSGIVNHEIPNWFVKSKLPSHEINCIQPWEDKVDRMIEDLRGKDLRVVSGIPPWIQMFFERTLNITAKSNIIDVFPNLELYIHGGVNYEPYAQKIDQLVGKKLQLIETYPASEGFIAYQDNPEIDSMRIVSNSGIFYEFVELKNLDHDFPERLKLEEVSLNTDYAIILSSNAGLWSYLIGDVVRFYSLQPYRLKVTGRVSQFISAFGEHVISSEVDAALSNTISRLRMKINEFSVAPQVNPENGGLPYHEWFIEFDEVVSDLPLMEKVLNEEMCLMNTYYKDLIQNKILCPLKITPIHKDGFKKLMIQLNQYGEQFKVKRLQNDRMLVDRLNEYRILRKNEVPPTLVK